MRGHFYEALFSDLQHWRLYHLTKMHTNQLLVLIIFKHATDCGLSLWKTCKYWRRDQILTWASKQPLKQLHSNVLATTHYTVELWQRHAPLIFASEYVCNLVLHSHLFIKLQKVVVQWFLHWTCNIKVFKGGAKTSKFFHVGVRMYV